jgi:3'-phosphoadenosine 5'-phosphosulfate sulfotransferase (PAPS reductase)/FAD synthetase
MSNGVNALRTRQRYPLDLKVAMSKVRISEYYKKRHGKVYVAFSGGKDSTVLLHLVRSLYPDIQGIFCDTGLEFPEIREFVKTVPNIEWIKPKMKFKMVLERYGYPVVSKEQAQFIGEIQRGVCEDGIERRLHGINGNRSGVISKKWQYLIDAPFKISDKCCEVMKKRPFKIYEKNGKLPFIGVMAEESLLRQQSYAKDGCNKPNGKQSRPLMFWLGEDIWEYIRQEKLSYSKIYDKGFSRTGCVFCAFGAHLDKPPVENKFQIMYKTHPKLYKYCMKGLGMKEILEYIKVPVEPKKV